MTKLTYEEKKTLISNVAFVVFAAFIAGAVCACVLIAYLEGFQL